MTCEHPSTIHPRPTHRALDRGGVPRALRFNDLLRRLHVTEMPDPALTTLSTRPCPFRACDRAGHNSAAMPATEKEVAMARRCELSGKAVLSGNLVSHSNHKTRTRFLPNLCNVTLISDSLQRSVRLRIAAAALRSVEHRGGLDAFLLKASDTDLSKGARALKREILKKAVDGPAA